MSNGFTDVDVVKTYNTLTKSGAGNYFLLDRPKYSNGTYWDADTTLGALIVELVTVATDTATYRFLTKTTEWAVDGVDPTKIQIFPSGMNWAGTFTTYRIALWWRLKPEQSYLGEGRLALSPQAIAAQFDLSQRLSLVAMEGLNRAIQISANDPNYDTFTGQNTHPSFLTLPPVASRAGKVIGFGPDGKLGYFANSSAGGSSTPDANTLVQRDASGRAQFADPSASQDVASKGYVDTVAATHAAQTAPHGAVSIPTPSVLMLRDGNGRSQVSDPSAAQDVATKAYADQAGGVAASLLVGATVDNVTTFGTLYSQGSPSSAPTGLETGTPITDVGGAGTANAKLQANFNASSPLVGTKDFQLTKLAANAQGAGVFWDVTVPLGFLGIPLTVQFPYLNTDVDDVFQYFIVAYTDSSRTTVQSIISLSDQYLKATSGTPAQAFATFFPTSSQYYRIFIHCALTTGTISKKLNVDNIVLTKYTTPNAAAVGGWTSYTPTFVGATPTGTNFRWRRVGQNMEVEGFGTWAAGGASAIQIPLPPGYAADSAIGTIQIVGWFGAQEAASSKSVFIIPSSTYFQLGDATTGWHQAIIGTAITNTRTFSFYASVPIAQWTTNINLATDFTEFAANASPTLGTDTSTTYQVRGFGNWGTFTAAMTIGTAYIRRVKFTQAINWGRDKLTLVYKSGSNIFANIEDNGAACKYMPLGASQYGYNITPVAGDPYSADLTLQAQGRQPGGVTYAANGNPWTDLVAAGWAICKVANGNMAEQPSRVITPLSAAVGTNTTYTIPAVPGERMIYIPAAYLKASSANRYTLTITTGSGNTVIVPISKSTDTISSGDLLFSIYVDQSGNVTAAPFQIYGSNTNGKFVTRSDGTMQCRFTNGSTSTVNTALGSVWTTPAAVTLTFPVPFASTPDVMANATYNTGNVWVQASTPSTTSCNFDMIGARNADIGRIAYIAEGVWR